MMGLLNLNARSTVVLVIVLATIAISTFARSDNTALALEKQADSQANPSPLMASPSGEGLITTMTVFPQNAPANLPTPTTFTYTINVENSSSTAITMDRIYAGLPFRFGTYAYVAGSSILNGNPIPDPDEEILPFDHFDPTKGSYTMLTWHLDISLQTLQPTDMVTLAFDIDATNVDVDQYCSEAWTNPTGSSSHTHKTARVTIGNPIITTCAGEAVEIHSTAVTQPNPTEDPSDPSDDILVTYTIQITNNEPTDLNIWWIRGILPPSFKYKFGLTGGDITFMPPLRQTINGTTHLHWFLTIPTVPIFSGTTRTLIFDATAPDTPGEYLNQTSFYFLELPEKDVAYSWPSAMITIPPVILDDVDLSINSVDGPASVGQGNIHNVTVIVENQGTQDSGPFIVALDDLTDNILAGSHLISGLAPSASTSIDFSWNTTGRSIGSHTLQASHNLFDGNSSNDSMTTSVDVTAAVTDIAITTVSSSLPVAFEGEVLTVDVTVENQGNQSVSSFDVSLNDQTDGLLIETQTIPSLSVGASTSLTFTWDTTGASIGNHTLQAIHDLSDDDGSDNSLTTTVNINGVFTDIAITSVTPSAASVTEGDTVTFDVVVQNQGNQPVGSFDVSLNDQTDGLLIETQTIPSLSVGASTSLTFTWDTNGASPGDHTMLTVHNLNDDDGSDNGLLSTVSIIPTSVSEDWTGANGNPWPSQWSADNANQADFFDINNNRGRLGKRSSAPGTGTVRTYINTADAEDVDASLTFNISSNAMKFGLMSRRSDADSDTHYYTRVESGKDKLSIHKVVDGADTKLGQVAIGSVTPGTDWKMRFLTETNGNATDLKAKVWLASSAEPGAFQIEIADGEPRLQGISGRFGMRYELFRSRVTHTDDYSVSFSGGTPPPDVTDIAMTQVTPSSSGVIEGDSVTVDVTVENIGNQPVGSFDVELEDSTDGITIGTQNVASMNPGDSATLTFIWDTTGASIADHTLTASHNLSDDDGNNDSLTAQVTVNAQVLDVAIASVTPSSSNVTEGSVVTVDVVVENQGNQPAGSFDVTLDDSTDGVPVGTPQNIAGLNPGGSATLTFTWDTTGVSTTTHTLLASHNFADGSPGNNSGTTTITVNPSVGAGTIIESWDGSNGSPWPAQWSFDEANQADFVDINNNRGRLGKRSSAPGNGVVTAYVNSAEAVDVDATTTFNISSNAMKFGLIARRADSDSDTYYYSLVESGKNKLQIYKVVDGIRTKLGQIAINTVSPNTDWKMRFHIQTNGSATDLKAKVWSASTSEPAFYQLELTDGESRLQGISGRFGMRYELFRSRVTHTDDYIAQH